MSPFPAATQEEIEGHDTTRRRVETLDAVARVAGGVARELSPLVRHAATAVHALLQSRPGDAELHAHLDPARESLQRSAVVLRHLESAGRLGSGRAEPVDVHAVIATMRPLIPRLAGPFIRCEEDLTDRGTWTLAEPGQVEQMLLTLVVNARDAMPLGGVLCIRTHHWTLDAPRAHRHGVLPAGEWFVLEVQDSGNGMDAQTLDHLFEPFFTTKLPAQGIGLGLAALHGMVHQRGGQIVVDSEAGGGTTVSLCFPADLVEVPSREATDGAAVLVVDDDEWVRTITARVLRRAGYGVLEAGHGEAALALLHDIAGSCVGTILAEVDTPRLSGHRLAEVVQRDRPELRVVLMSGDATRWDAAERVLRKPFTPTELLAAVGGAVRG
jgi:nitrogen-specific signal transduction histidine kinase